MFALLAGSLSDVITFNKSPFHAVFAEGPDICITAHDIHRLTGSLDIAVGGKVAVHVDNGTIPDYTLTIGGPWGPKGPFMRRNVSATFTCKGKTVTANGTADVLVQKPQPPMLEEFSLSTDPHAPGAIFEKGINPPPPPPPPPTCGTTGAANQSACDAVKPKVGSGPACSWCESKDGIHSLCFVYNHTPDASSWNCDR
jgi:hypothetical protein